MMFLNSTAKFIRYVNNIHLPQLRCISTEVNTKNLFVNILGIKEEDAQNYIDKHNIDRLEINRLKDTLHFIKKKNYNVVEVLKNPKLFQQCGNKTWEHYYAYFKECGCTDVPLINLINFRKIRYSSIRELKEQGVIPQDATVVQNLLNQLDLPLDEVDVSDLRNDSLTLSYVHRAIIHRYLMNRLGATVEHLETISRIHSQIYNKSLKKFCENINLALDIGFTPLKILRNTYILQVKPENTREILEKIPNFLNCDMRAQMRNFPKLIGLSLEHIYNIYDILKASNIPDKTIANTMNIFTLATKTVEERLEDIKSTPETKVLMTNPRTLELIVHYHRAQNRLQFLHKIKLKCASLVVIGFDAAVFENYIKEGKDVNKRMETDTFIRALLNCTKSDVDIQFRRHPYYLYVPFIEIQSTYSYLKRMRFENDHIIKAISILLYPKDKIADVLNKIKEEHYISTRKPRANKSQILNLALYYLEKDHHFSGNGIWRINEDYAP